MIDLIDLIDLHLPFRGQELGVFKAKEAAGWAYGVLKSDQEESRWEREHMSQH